jgi:hypothetical protein
VILKGLSCAIPVGASREPRCRKIASDGAVRKKSLLLDVSFADGLSVGRFEWSVKPPAEPRQYALKWRVCEPKESEEEKDPAIFVRVDRSATRLISMEVVRRCVGVQREFSLGRVEFNVSPPTDADEWLVLALI